MGTTNVLLDDKAQKIMQNVYKLGSSLYTYQVIAKDDGNDDYSFTFQCDNPELDSYDKLAQYLLSKGYYEHHQAGKDSYCPILSAVSDRTSAYNSVNGLLVNKTALSDGQPIIEVNTIYISSGSVYTSHNRLKSDNFEIILVTK